MDVPPQVWRILGEATAASRRAESIGSFAAWSYAAVAWVEALQDPLIQRDPGLVCDVQVQLGHALASRFDTGQEVDGLTDAIACYRAALDMPESAPVRDSLFGDLALVLINRQQATGALGDLDEALAAYDRAITGGQLDQAHREALQTNYGLALYRRHQAVGDRRALDQSIEELRGLAEAVDPVNRANAASNLGIALRARYETGHDPADLDASIEAQRRALAACKPGTDSWARWTSNLGNALHNRFQLRGEESDLREAVAAQREALALLPPGTPAWIATQVNFGSVLASSLDRFGDPADLDASVSAYEQAVAAAPEGSGPWMVAANGLVGMLKTRFQARGYETDLETATTLGEQVLHGTSPSSPQRVSALIRIGMVRRLRYAVTADQAEIDDALAALREAVSATRSGGRYRGEALGSLAEALITRHKVAGDYADLDAAIELLREGLAIVPAGSGQHADMAASLGEALGLRNQDAADPAATEESIALHRTALAAVHPGSGKWIRWTGGLTAALRLRYDNTGDLDDLDAAIAALREAVSVPQPHGSDWAGAQIELSGALIERAGLRRRFSRFRAGPGAGDPDAMLGRGGAVADLDGAVAAAAAAELRLRSGSPEWMWCQLALGDAYRLRYEAGRDPGDGEGAARAYRQVLDADPAAVPTQWIATSAVGLAELRALQGAWDDAAAAYDQALPAFDKLYGAQLMTVNRETALGRGADVWLRAAYALAHAGRLEDAVGTLEQGRTRALSAALARDRADLDQLHVDDPEAFEGYERAAARVRQLETAERAGRGEADGALSGEALRERAGTARAEFAEAVRRIRSIDGHEGFLVAPGWAEVAAGLAETQSPPVVYLLTTWAGGLALIVWPKPQTPAATTVEAVWLDEMTGARMRDLFMGVEPAGDQGWSGSYAGWRQDPGRAERRRGWFDVIETTTRVLWQVAMSPVLERLRKRGATAATLVPTGLLSLLPLHAACVEDADAPSGARYAMDELVLSYAPSTLAAAHARRTARRAAGEVLLAVDEPQPVTAPPLPGSAVEVSAVAAMFEQPTVLSGRAATRAAVLGRLSGADVVHLSCHGRTDWGDPLRSGVVLAGDEWLTVGDLLGRQLPDARLACLSACETGVIGLMLPDEAVALPAAFLQAGFAAVVASLWTVSDIATAMLMQRFYGLWRERGGDPAMALRDAQRWLRDTTNGQKAEYFRGELPALDGLRLPQAFAAELFTAAMVRHADDRDFAHPFWWAAFSVTGA